MRNINFKALIWIAVICGIAAWLTMLLINSEPVELSFASLKYVSSAVIFDLFLWFLFVKWGWRFRLFQGWLVPFPVLHGTWHGTINSMWVDEKTGERPPPISVVLVIKQSFLRVDCEVLSHTEESSSRSYAAEFLINVESGAKSLLYSYANRPRVAVRDRSPMHDGTALLEIISKPDRRLLGEYWTNRGTVGEINLSFYSKDLQETFPETLRAAKNSESGNPIPD